jgi:hypothetical protein
MRGSSQTKFVVALDESQTPKSLTWSIHTKRAGGVLEVDVFPWQRTVPICRFAPIGGLFTRLAEVGGKPE